MSERVAGRWFILGKVHLFATGHLLEQSHISTWKTVLFVGVFALKSQTFSFAKESLPLSSTFCEMLWQDFLNNCPWKMPLSTVWIAPWYPKKACSIPFKDVLEKIFSRQMVIGSNPVFESGFTFFYWVVYDWDKTSCECSLNINLNRPWSNYEVPPFPWILRCLKHLNSWVHNTWFHTRAV